MSTIKLEEHLRNLVDYSKSVENTLEKVYRDLGGVFYQHVIDQYKRFSDNKPLSTDTVIGVSDRAGHNAEEMHIAPFIFSLPKFGYYNALHGDTAASGGITLKVSSVTSIVDATDSAYTAIVGSISRAGQSAEVAGRKLRDVTNLLNRIESSDSKTATSMAALCKAYITIHARANVWLDRIADPMDDIDAIVKGGQGLISR